MIRNIQELVAAKVIKHMKYQDKKVLELEKELEIKKNHLRHINTFNFPHHHKTKVYVCEYCNAHSIVTKMDHGEIHTTVHCKEIHKILCKGQIQLICDECLEKQSLKYIFLKKV